MYRTLPCPFLFHFIVHHVLIVSLYDWEKFHMYTILSHFYDLCCAGIPCVVQIFSIIKLSLRSPQNSSFRTTYLLHRPTLSHFPFLFVCGEPNANHFLHTILSPTHPFSSHFPPHLYSCTTLVQRTPHNLYIHTLHIPTPHTPTQLHFHTTKLLKE
jgi:hypothetical protein